MTTSNRIPAPPMPQRRTGAPDSTTTPPLPGGIPGGNSATPASLPWQKPTEDPGAQRTLVYGQGGLGKSRLCCAAPGPVLVFDFDKSVGNLWGQLPDRQKANLLTYSPNGWGDFLEKLQNKNLFGGIKTIVVDTATVAERASDAYVLETVRSPSGKANSIEDYGYGKGYRFIFEQWIRLLAIADEHIRDGRNIIFVAHATNNKVANPSSEDFQRVEPALQGTDKFSIRNRLFEWVDHCIYYDWDKAVNENGKVTGGSSRTIYTHGQNWFMAKTRRGAPEAIYPDVNNLEDVWTQLFA